MSSFEEFSENQKKILEHYVTNTSGSVFVLRNLPEVIKGALFSRYSRSTLGLRSLLLKEFILSEETSFESIVAHVDSTDEQVAAIKKAQNFYDRILDGYGDDSIGELGGAHLALENISMIAAKAVEDLRIGGSPLEKSTRYIYFDQKVKGEYLFYKEPILMTSAYRDLYLNTCTRLFDTYSRLIPQLTDVMEEMFPKEPEVSKTAYAAALRAKVLDVLRGLLPASTLTNMGVFGNGRFFEMLLRKLQSHSLAEMQELGKGSFEELAKVIPSFIRRADPTHKTQVNYARFMEAVSAETKLNIEKHRPNVERLKKPGVRLISYDPDSVIKVASALMFSGSNVGLYEWQQYLRELPEEEIARILDAAHNARENRRHKSPRALEHANFTFEVISDYGSWRDLQRHRMFSQEKQLLSCDYGYSIPPELKGTPMEKEYAAAMDEALEAYNEIARQLPEEAQYIVPMGYNIRWYLHGNLRALQWMCELRASPQGHANYRAIAQEIARQVCQVFPQFEPFFKFVDFQGHELGRLSQEIRRVEKKEGEGSSKEDSDLLQGQFPIDLGAMPR